MTQVTLVKNSQGKLQGLDLKGQRAYQRWKTMVETLEVGQMVSFSFRMPRSLAHHRLLFVKLQSLLARSETFTTLDGLRKWVIVGAGYVDYIPGPDYTPNAIPQSLDFDSMDESVFCEFHAAMDNFLWTDVALMTLWPSLSHEARYACMDSFMREFQ